MEDMQEVKRNGPKAWLGGWCVSKLWVGTSWHELHSREPCRWCRSCPGWIWDPMDGGTHTHLLTWQGLLPLQNATFYHFSRKESLSLLLNSSDN